jgi:Peptidase of plants and bacteria
MDAAGGGLAKLNDGKMPTEEDQPDENFFFNEGTPGGRLVADLGSVISIKQINTYSWHPSTRGPQIYKLYASDGTSKDFNAAPANGVNPESCGWKHIVSVSTKSKGEGEDGGQYGVSISDTDGAIGKYRYLLFDTMATEHDDDFGNTFYSEINVIDAGASGDKADAEGATDAFTVKTADGKTEITIDTTGAPELKNWAQNNLAPVMADWYPKIVAMLPSDGYEAPSHFSITLKPIKGVAFTSGTKVVANSEWLGKELHGEAIGSLVHEMVHVVQQFHGRNPGWLVEGSADYVRWFKYEPQSHGADIVWMQKRRNFTPNYTDSYRITANFLNWVADKYDGKIVEEMDAAMRGGKYNEDLWKKYTGKTAPELGDEWKKIVESQLASAKAPEKTN